MEKDSKNIYMKKEKTKMNTTKKKTTKNNMNDNDSAKKNTNDNTHNIKMNEKTNTSYNESNTFKITGRTTLMGIRRAERTRGYY